MDMRLNELGANGIRAIAPARLPGEPAPVLRWRQEALELLATLGLPSARDEHWRRANFGFETALAAHVDAGGRPAPAVTAESLAKPATAMPAHLDAASFAGFTHLLFIDGRFEGTRGVASDDDPALDITALHTALRSAPPACATLLPHTALTGDLRLALLNHALGADGVRLLLRRGQRARRPIVLDHRGALAHEGVSAVSHLVRLEAGAHATLVELHDERCTAARALLSEVRIELGAGSRLLHVRLVASSHASHLVDTTSVVLERDAHYEQRALLAPLRALRSTQTIELAGPGSRADLRVGAVAGRGADVDLRVLATHAADATRSEQTVHVLGARGRATVDSEAKVPAGRRAIVSRQSLRAVQPDGSCDVALRPRLAILSDDVDCRHGATTSAFSDEQLFFLRSRGFAADEAKRLLAAAHLQQLYAPSGDEALDALVQRQLQSALATAIPAPSPAEQSS